MYAYLYVYLHVYMNIFKDVIAYTCLCTYMYLVRPTSTVNIRTCACVHIYTCAYCMYLMCQRMGLHLSYVHDSCMPSRACTCMCVLDCFCTCAVCWQTCVYIRSCMTMQTWPFGRMYLTVHVHTLPYTSAHCPTPPPHIICPANTLHPHSHS